MKVNGRYSYYLQFYLIKDEFDDQIFKLRDEKDAHTSVGNQPSHASAVNYFSTPLLKETSFYFRLYRDFSSEVEFVYCNHR